MLHPVIVLLLLDGGKVDFALRADCALWHQGAMAGRYHPAYRSPDVERCRLDSRHANAIMRVGKPIVVKREDRLRRVGQHRGSGYAIGGRIE